MMYSRSYGLAVMAALALSAGSTARNDAAQTGPGEKRINPASGSTPVAGGGARECARRKRLIDAGKLKTDSSAVKVKK